MSQSALMRVMLAVLEWQDSTNENQKVTAQTINLAASLLMALYNAAEEALDKLMHTSTDPKNPYKPESYDPATQGKPAYPKGGSDKQKQLYAQNIQIWQTYYNQQNQGWQNKENNLNTPIQSLDQHESSLGNEQAKDAEIAGVICQPGKVIASLLQGPL